jgi:bifunctional DNA-binding transcriptional regulator/antitoxin component of YhaV-PrlF toxin-antitoxin module
MIYEVTASSRGTITIFAAFRKELELEPGQNVISTVEGKTLVLEFGKLQEKARSQADRPSYK